MSRATQDKIAGTADPAPPDLGPAEGPDRSLSLLAHDLRSAMSDVIGGLRMIDRDALDGKVRAQLDRVRSSGEVLARLVEDLLDTHLDGAGAGPGHAPSNLHLGRFLKDLSSRWSGHAEAGQMGFAVTEAEGLPQVLSIDRIALERVLGNLIGNALKYARTEGATLAVDLRPGGELRFRVLDDGPGFSDAALAQLFQFAGRPQGSAQPGSGLGLYIAKHLADGLGGRLSITNREGGGAAATLLLPERAWSPARHVRAAPPRDGTAELTDLTGLKVLVAEDNETNQLLAAQMLETLGAEYRIADDGIEALNWLDREDFDLALIDIEMPRLDGIEVIRAIRGRQGPTAGMPLVALTAYVLKANRDAIYAAGANGIIAKPIMDIGVFSAALRAFGKRPGDDPPAEAPDPATPPLDPARIDALLDIAGPLQSSELLDRLIADLARSAARLETACAGADRAEARAASHVLISLSGAVGAAPLHHLVNAVNTASHAGDRAELARLGPLVAAETDRVLAPLHHRRQTIPEPQ